MNKRDQHRGRLRTAASALSITCSLLLLLAIGCSEQTQDAESSDGTATESSPDAGSSGTPQTTENTSPGGNANQLPWKAWQQPALALMLTTEMHGFFEPCGCTSNQLGGMSRRADLRKKMVDAGWTVRGLDVGGLARRHVRQAQIKFETTVAALKDLQYEAIGLGPEELKLQPDFLLSQHITDGDNPLHFLSANLTFYDAADLGTPARHHIFEANGIKVGVTSVLGRRLKSEVLSNPDITWTEHEEPLKKALAEFEQQQVDLKVLLSQATVEESLEFAAQYSEFDIVLTAEGTGDPDPAAPPQQVGQTLVIEAGRKGKYVGILGFYPEAKERFQYKLVPLEREDFDDTESMIALMRDYQTRLKEEQIVLVDGIGAPHPSGATYVGAATCGECHTKAMEVWQNTPHAHALDSLDPTHKRKGYERLNGVNRTYDPECLSCHVTGWDPQEYIRYESGFLNEDFAATDEEKRLHSLLGGNQCENCHGPGSRHIALIEADDTEAARAEVRVTWQQAKKQGLCERCHDADNSPHFEFDEYWQQVVHPGLD